MQCNFHKLLGPCIVLMSTGFAMRTLAAIDDKEPPSFVMVEGAIKAVDPANHVFILTMPGAKKSALRAEVANDVTLTFDLKTNFWLDGKPTTMDQALIVGNSARVAHVNGLALKVQVKSKPA